MTADDYRPADVVVLDTGEVCGLMTGDVINPWSLLNDQTDDGEQIFYETDYIDEHKPELIARDGQPVNDQEHRRMRLARSLLESASHVCGNGKGHELVLEAIAALDGASIEDLAAQRTTAAVSAP